MVRVWQFINYMYIRCITFHVYSSPRTCYDVIMYLRVPEHIGNPDHILVYIANAAGGYL